MRADRRRWLSLGCAHCLAACLAPARAAEEWSPPARHLRPQLNSEEGGLWALFDREEARIRRGAFLVQSERLKAYLLDVACRLAGEHCPDVRVYPMRTPYPNASMAPNGMMEVWSGLLLRLDNEAQLAAVIGHEMGHYMQRHSLALLRDAKSRSAFMSLMVPFGLVGLAGQLAALGGQSAYSRDNEREADRIGVALMKRSAYDAREAAKVWAHLRAELAAGVGGDPEKRSVMFASHPGVAERQTVLADLAGDAEGELGSARYEECIEPLLTQMGEDELSRGQYGESIALFERHCERRPRHGLLRYFLGEARRLRATPADLAAAQADYLDALKLDSPPPQAHRALGYLYRQRGERAAARDALANYLQALPEAGDAALVKSYLQELSP